MTTPETRPPIFRFRAALKIALGILLVVGALFAFVHLKECAERDENIRKATARQEEMIGICDRIHAHATDGQGFVPAKIVSLRLLADELDAKLKEISFTLEGPHMDRELGLHFDFLNFQTVVVHLLERIEAINQARNLPFDAQIEESRIDERDRAILRRSVELIRMCYKDLIHNYTGWQERVPNP